MTDQVQVPFVVCALCGAPFHVLIPHLKDQHLMTGVEYLKRFPDAPLWSDTGKASMQAAISADKEKQSTQGRAKKTVDLGDLFPDFYKEKGLRIKGAIEIFAAPGEHTPKPTEYIFPEKETLLFLKTITSPRMNTVYFCGPSGTGKTSFAYAIAAKCNANLLEFNADFYQQRSSLVGSWRVNEHGTYFEKGVLPIAMEKGYWLLVNEIDTWSPDLLNVIKPVLEEDSRLPLPELGGILLRPHPDFRIFSTANTWGRGDDRGIYGGTTHVLSDADIRRWAVKIPIQYLAPDREIAMLRAKFPLTQKQAERFVKVAGRVREAFQSRKIDKTLSSGELINWVYNWIRFSEATDFSVHEAADYTFIQTCDEQTTVVLNECIVAEFGKRGTQ